MHESGMVCDITGTAEPVAATFNKPVFDKKGLVETHHSAHSGLWLIENPGFVSGGSTRWFIDNILRKPGYKEMNEIAMGETSFLGKVDPEAKETLVNYIAPKDVATVISQTMPLLTRPEPRQELCSSPVPTMTLVFGVRCRR